MNHEMQLKYNDIEECNVLDVENKVSSNNNQYNNEISPENIIPPSTILREAREKNGMSVKATAKKLFLETSMIRILESDKYEKLPNVFVRGYLRNYAKLQDIPQKDIMESFEKMIDQQPTLSPIKPKLKPYLIPYLNNFANFEKNIFLSIIGIIITIIALMLLSSQFNPANSYQSIEKILFPTEVTTQTTDNMAESNIIMPTIIPIQVVPKISTPVELVEVEILKTSNKNPNVTTETPAETSVVNPYETLKIHFTEKAWVMVIDQERKKLYQGIGKIGEILLLEGIPPFNIKAGNFAGIYIEYDDKTSNIRDFPKHKQNRRTFIIGH
ncbi:MAG: DUF4115 domain-containing protein [Candidatus Marithrix sp.]